MYRRPHSITPQYYADSTINFRTTGMICLFTFNWLVWMRARWAEHGGRAGGRWPGKRGAPRPPRGAQMSDSRREQIMPISFLKSINSFQFENVNDNYIITNQRKSRVIPVSVLWLFIYLTLSVDLKGGKHFKIDRCFLSEAILQNYC